MAFCRLPRGGHGRGATLERIAYYRIYWCKRAERLHDSEILGSYFKAECTHAKRRWMRRGCILDSPTLRGIKTLPEASWWVDRVGSWCQIADQPCSAALNSPSRDDSAGPHGSSSGCWSSPGTISLNRTRRTAPHRAGEAAVLRREEVEDVAPHAVEAAVLRREEVEDVAPHAVEAAVLRREEVAATPHCAGEATDGSLCTLRRLLPQSQRRPAQVTHSPEQQALLFETVAALSDLTSTFSTASGAGVRHSALRRSAHRKRRRGK
eukprot:gene22896-biopygen2786